MDNITINGVAVTDANFNDTTPAAAAGREVLLWQRSGTAPDQISVQTSAAIPVVLDREMTDLAITNSTVETVIFSHSVPANALGTNRSINLKLIAEVACPTASTHTLRVKFGGTTIFNDLTASHSADVDERAVFMDLWLGNQGATNDQTGGGIYASSTVGAIGAPTTGIAGSIDHSSIDGDAIVFADSAIDTTLAQTFEVTWQFTTAAASNIFRRKMAILTLF